MIIKVGTREAELMGGVPCFVCGETVEAPFVFWHGPEAGGDEANVVFHPECSREFGTKFINDVEELNEAR